MGNFIQAEAKLKAQSQSKGSKISTSQLAAYLYGLEEGTVQCIGDLIASTQEKFDKASDTISEIEDCGQPCGPC